MELEEQEEETSMPTEPKFNLGQIQKTSSAQKEMATVPSVETSSTGLPADDIAVDASTINPSAVIADTAYNTPPTTSAVIPNRDTTEVSVNTVTTSFFGNAIPDTTTTDIFTTATTTGATLKRKLPYEGGEAAKRPRREYVFVYNGH
jgi:hypothetical protein